MAGHLERHARPVVRPCQPRCSQQVRPHTPDPHATHTPFTTPPRHHAPRPACSFECLAGSNTISRDVTFNISRTSIMRSALPAVNRTIGGGVYVAPAEDV